MSKLSIFVIALGALVLATPGCRKLAPPAAVPSQSWATENAVPPAYALPTSWGRLAGVSSVADYPDLVQMWFEDGGGVIRVAVLRVRTGEVLTVKRLGRG